MISFRWIWGGRVFVFETWQPRFQWSWCRCPRLFWQEKLYCNSGFSWFLVCLGIWVLKPRPSLGDKFIFFFIVELPQRKLWLILSISMHILEGRRVHWMIWVGIAVVTQLMRMRRPANEGGSFPVCMSILVFVNDDVKNFFISFVSEDGDCQWGWALQGIQILWRI